MRLGGIGHIDRDGVIQLPQEILSSLTIFNGCILYGVYYSNFKNGSQELKHDFCISPIPYEFWPITAKLIIKVKDQSKGLKAICALLRKHNVNILHCSTTRSGFRYSVIDIYIAFETLSEKKDNLTFKEKGHYYEETYSEMKNLEMELSKNTNDFLFTDEDDNDLQFPVVSKINTALHFFYYNTKMNRELDPGNVIYKEFTLRYKNGSLTEDFSEISSNTGGKVASIITKADMDQARPKKRGLFLLPSICFISSDPDYLNLRVIILPGEKKNNFLKLDIFYQRCIEPNSTQGLLLFLLEKFSPRYKIWKYFNQLYECRDLYGAGKLTFYIEDDNRNFESQIIHTDIEEYIKQLNDQLPSHLRHISLTSKSQNVYPEYINNKLRFNRFKNVSKTYDIFLSYSYKNSNEANEIYRLLTETGCNVFMSQHILKAGDSPDKIIKQELRDSRELCLLYSPDSEESQWVMTEWAVAWALEKKIVPILLEMHPKHVKDFNTKRLFEIQYIKYHDRAELEKYAREAFIRRYDYLFQKGLIY